MTGRPWYAFYPDAYERAAGALSYVQDSAYRRMLDHYYKTGEPLPLDRASIHRACRAMRRDERAAIDAVLDAFFTKEEDGYHQSRADEEITRAADISAKRAGAANKRHCKTDAIAEQLDTHSTATTTPSEAKASSDSRTPAKPRNSKPEEIAGFSEFYDHFPLHKARPAAAKAYARAVTRASGAVILAGCLRYAKSRIGEDANYTKHPATWLNNDCWLDQDPTPRTGGRNGDKSSSTSFGSSIGRVVESRAERGLAFQDGGGDHRASDALEDEGGPGDGNPQLRLTAEA